MSTARADELDESSSTSTFVGGACNELVFSVISLTLKLPRGRGGYMLLQLMSNTPEINLSIDDFKARVRVLACSLIFCTADSVQGVGRLSGAAATGLCIPPTARIESLRVPLHTPLGSQWDG